MNKKAVLTDIYNNAFEDEFVKTAYGSGLINTGINFARRAFTGKTDILAKGARRLAGFGAPASGGSGYLERGLRFMGTKAGNIAGATGAVGLGAGYALGGFGR